MMFRGLNESLSTAEPCQGANHYATDLDKLWSQHGTQNN